MKNKLNIGYFLKTKRHLVLFFIYLIGEFWAATCALRLDGITVSEEYEMVLSLGFWAGFFFCTLFYPRPCMDHGNVKNE